MSNATRFYTSVEQVKRAAGIVGSQADALIASYIEAASEHIEQMLQSRAPDGAKFIPITQTRLYRWPQAYATRPNTLELDQDLLAVTTLQTKAQDASPTTIASTDYFLEPNNAPPYRRIEIDQSSSASFEAGDTPQRSISVAGRWGYSEDTKAAGTLAEALDSSETGVDITDASLVDVGDTLKCESEQLFVSDRSALTTGTTLNDTLTASLADVTVTVASGAAVKQGEEIILDSERMLVELITGNDLTVKRAVNGSTLAAHSTGATVYALRTLTVVRGVNGTTAAAHDTSTALTKYMPPADVRLYCLAKTLLDLKQGESGWTGQISGGESGITIKAENVPVMEENLIKKYGEVTV